MRIKRTALCAGPHPTGETAPKFWNVVSSEDDSGEITLYGDVLSRQPVDFWTGEPAPGMFITPEGFLDDLESVKSKSKITIKINSCGGDVYTGLAIHNALKGLTGKKTVIVEGIAASAASVIACAGDDVQMYPGSIIMIHGVSIGLMDYFDMRDLKRLQKDVDANERAIAEIYHAKCGLAVDTLRAMMAREEWMVGQEAIDLGFADTLLSDAGPEMTLSADKRVLMVAGVRHDISAFRRIPGEIPISKNQIQAAPAAGHISKPTENGGQHKEDKFMTLEELRAQHPELVAQIEQLAVDAATPAAVATERSRLQAIESIEAGIADSALIQSAKYGENPMTAEQLALAAMQRQASRGAQHLADVKDDAEESGTKKVGAAPNSGTANDEDDEKSKVDSAVNLYNATKNGGKK